MSILVVRCHYDVKISMIHFIKKYDDKIRKINSIPVNTDSSGFMVINH
jgi:hypothetical protein